MYAHSPSKERASDSAAKNERKTTDFSLSAVSEPGRKMFFGTPSMPKFFLVKKTSQWSLLAVTTDILVSKNLSVVPVSLIPEEILRKTWEPIKAHTLKVSSRL